jgi:hypothetical protein
VKTFQPARHEASLPQKLPHSSQTRLEWATRPALLSIEGVPGIPHSGRVSTCPLIKICNRSF